MSRILGPRTILRLTVIGTLALSTSAAADDVLAGFDAWTTPPDGAFHDFGTTPLPGGFFYPGSDPFLDNVPLQGAGVGPCGDTLIARLADATPLPVGGSAVVPIEIVQLDLVSVDPIIVSPDNTPWDVQVTLAPGPQPGGSMTIEHTYGGGGRYSSNQDICPLFNFTETVPPFRFAALDLCAEMATTVQVSTTNKPWSHNVRLPLLCPLSTANFRAEGPHDGPHPGAVPLEGVIKTYPAPGLGAWGVSVIAALAAAGSLAFHRRRARVRS